MLMKDTFTMALSTCKLSAERSMSNLKKQSFVSDDDVTETTASISSFSSGRNSVSFGSVLVHFHPIVLSDNPAVREGPPIELAWTASYSKLFHVDELRVDEEKSTAGNVKRIVRAEREKWLKEKGFCETCLQKVLREIEAIKKSRLEEVAIMKKRCKAAESKETIALESYKLMSTASHRAINRELRRSLQKSSNAGIVKKVERMRQKQTQQRPSLFGRFAAKSWRRRLRMQVPDAF